MLLMLFLQRLGQGGALPHSAFYIPHFSCPPRRTSEAPLIVFERDPATEEKSLSKDGVQA